MSTRAAVTRFTLTLISCAVLAACAGQAPRPVATPAVVTALPTTPEPALAAPTPAAAPDNQLWADIAAGDALGGCESSPAVLAAAASYTRSPDRFEQQLRASLPLILYVHDELKASGVPGEFTMLPMVESSYQPRAVARRNGPMGLWQFMPATARQHGVVVNRDYDGRFDAIASTRAAIRMLKSLEQQFGDWRLVDIAYNAGPLAVQSALRGRVEPGDGAVPDIPMSSTNRNHLVRLIALNCILRDPAHFKVELPRATPADRLVAVEVPAGTRLASAATLAGLTESNLRSLNPAYRAQSVPADSPRKLLMPAAAAETLAAAMSMSNSERLARADAPTRAASDPGAIPLPSEPPAPPMAAAPDDAPATATPPSRHHRVRSGETLWSIAQRYGVSVHDLRRWNNLRDGDLRTGQDLRVHG